ncbi:MAG: translation initiation factor IF-2 N-terminal domain-containing protein [Candidatus Methylomirabilales bacterium]
MAKIRVYQLAKELGLSSKEAVQRLAEAGIPVKSHTSSVDDAAARAALSKPEISEKKLSENVAKDKPATKPKRAKRTKLKDKSAPKAKRAKRTKKGKKKSKPVAEPQADLKPSPEALEEVPGIKPEPISLPTEERLPEKEIFPSPTPLEAETPTEPPTELEAPGVDVHPAEGAVMEESAPEEEQLAPEIEEPVAPTKPSELEKPVTPTVSFKGLRPDLIKRVAGELGFDVESPAVPNVIQIPEMITVRELGEKLATSPGEIIKKLKDMEIVATIDWTMNSGMARRVAAEFGFEVEVTRVEDPLELWQDIEDVDVSEAREPDETFADHDRAPVGDLHQRMKEGLVRVRVRGEEGEKGQEEARSPYPTTTIPEEPDRDWVWRLPSEPSPASSVRYMRTELWIVAGAIVTMALLAWAVPRERGTQSPEMTTPTATSVDQGKRVATVPPPEIEELPAPPPAPLREWKVLHHFPRDGQKEQARRGAIRIFFNRPVEKDVVEHAFNIEPHEAGRFSWPKPDRLVFTPTTPLLPATEYTVTLTSVTGPQPKEEYKLLEARWSFTTGAIRTYGKDIKPLISAYCSQCHGARGQAARIPLQTYQHVSRYVVAGHAEQSPLYTFVQQRQHHINMAGPTHSTNDKLAVVKDWINVDKAAE